MLEAPRLSHRLTDLSGIVEYPGSASFPEIARQCDWVIAADNSNVHLPLLKLGIPTVAVSNLGIYPKSRSDLYGFIEHGIVFPPIESIRDLRGRRVRRVLLGLLGDAIQAVRRVVSASPGRDRGRSAAGDTAAALRLTGEGRACVT